MQSSRQETDELLGGCLASEDVGGQAVQRQHRVIMADMGQYHAYQGDVNWSIYPSRPANAYME
jgi:hypothetical protein